MGQVTEEAIDEKFPDALCRIASNPLQAASLHDLLGPFCHESRNLLNSLKLCLYLAHRADPDAASDVWARVDHTYAEFECLLDRLQLICRPVRLCLVKLPLGMLLEERRRAWLDLFAARGERLEMVATSEAEVGEYDPQLLGRALDAFVGWRAQTGFPGRTCRLRWGSERGRFFLEWDESKGAAAPAASRRCAASGGNREPLALPLLSRIVSAHGGNIDVRHPEGRHVRLCWPRSTGPPG